MDEEMLYNFKLGITEKDVMETNDIELLAQWQADMYFQFYWLDTDEKKNRRKRIYANKFYEVIKRRISYVKKNLKTDAGFEKELKKERKLKNGQAEQFMLIAKQLLPDDVYTEIFEEASRRHKEALELAKRFKEETKFVKKGTINSYM